MIDHIEHCSFLVLFNTGCSSSWLTGVVICCNHLLHIQRFWRSHHAKSIFVCIHTWWVPSCIPEWWFPQMLFFGCCSTTNGPKHWRLRIHFPLTRFKLLALQESSQTMDQSRFFQDMFATFSMRNHYVSMDNYHFFPWFLPGFWDSPTGATRGGTDDEVVYTDLRYSDVAQAVRGLETLE